MATKAKSDLNDKPLTRIEFIKVMTKAKTVHTIVYPDGTTGELNKGAVVI